MDSDGLDGEWENFYAVVVVTVTRIGDLLAILGSKDKSSPKGIYCLAIFYPTLLVTLAAFHIQLGHVFREATCWVCEVGLY